MEEGTEKERGKKISEIIGKKNEEEVVKMMMKRKLIKWVIIEVIYERDICFYKDKNS